jgi:hypothetical protein
VQKIGDFHTMQKQRKTPEPIDAYFAPIAVSVVAPEVVK